VAVDATTVAGVPDEVGARPLGHPRTESRSATGSPATGRARRVRSARTMSEGESGIGGTDVVVEVVVGVVVPVGGSLIAVVVGVVVGTVGVRLVPPPTGRLVTGPPEESPEPVAAAVVVGIGPRPGGKSVVPPSATMTAPMPAASSCCTRAGSSRP